MGIKRWRLYEHTHLGSTRVAYLTTGRSNQATQYPQEGGFTSPVFSHQTANLPTVHTKLYLIQRQLVPVPLGQI